jgi:hypothetical protein
MKTSKKTGKEAPSKAKKGPAPAAKTRKMEPLKSKELKNQRFEDSDDDEESEPEIIEDNFKDFDEFFDDSDEDDD